MRIEMHCKCGAEFSAHTDDVMLSVAETAVQRLTSQQLAEKWIAAHAACNKPQQAFQPAPMPGPPWKVTCAA